MKNKKENRGGWKEFFMPAKLKISLTIILLVAFPLMLLIGIELVKPIFYLPLMGASYFTKEIKAGFETVGISTISSLLVGLMTYLIEIYLTSCLIYFVIRKIKMKGVKRRRKKIQNSYIMNIFRLNFKNIGLTILLMLMSYTVLFVISFICVPFSGNSKNSYSETCFNLMSFIGSFFKPIYFLIYAVLLYVISCLIITLIKRIIRKNAS